MIRKVIDVLKQPEWVKDGERFAPPPPLPEEPPHPLDAEELFDMLEAAGVLSATNRPRPRAKPVSPGNPNA